MSRTLAQSVSPALTGFVMQGLSLTAPFFLGAGLKIVYDLWLYATIRHVKTSCAAPGARPVGNVVRWGWRTP